MNCPPIAESLVIAEDARLAARISCALAAPGRYLPVIEGPRLLAPDPVAELVRRTNAVARVRPDRIFLTGLSDEAHDGLKTRFASKLQTRMQRISTLEEIERLGDPGRFRNPPLVWGVRGGAIVGHGAAA